MNIEEMKKKFESGEYIFMYKAICGYQRYTNARLLDNYDYKLIHKKHEHILNAYLNNEVVACGENGSSCGVHYQIGSHDWIECYSEGYSYIIVEDSPYDIRKQIELNSKIVSSLDNSFEEKHNELLIKYEKLCAKYNDLADKYISVKYPEIEELKIKE